MKKLLYLFVVGLLCGWTASAVAAERAESVTYVEFQKILDTKCGKCHTRTRIDEAMAAGKAFQPIEERMVKHGALLTDRERDVMGVFWVENAGGQQREAVAQDKDDPLGEYRAIVRTRCTGCHSLDRIEEAMRQNRSFEHLAEMMLKRGAVLTEADYKVIGTFWGEPLREKE